jgi:cell division protein FtsB
VLPEVLTVRLIVLSVVVLLALVLLVPTVRGAVQQSAEIDRLRAELARHEAERDRLEVELARWEDRTYVVEQARSRLQFVFPGDKVWRTLDADTVVEDVDPLTGQAVDAGPVGTDPTTGVPWYQSVWESVQVADGPTPSPGPDDEESADDDPSSSPSPSDDG